MARFRVLIALVLLSVVFVAGWALWPRQDLERSGDAIIDAALLGDASRLMAFLGPSEKRLEHIETNQLQEFLSAFVLPKLSGYVRSGLPKSYPDEFAHHLIVVQELKGPGGRIVELGFDVLQTPDGPKCDELCYSLLAAACQAIGPDRRGLTGQARARASLQVWEEALPELAKLQLPGVALEVEVGHPSRLITWDEFTLLKQARIVNAP